jgi:hypothetical protein
MREGLPASSELEGPFMTQRIPGALAATILLAVLAAPASAETRSTLPNAGTIVLAQATPDSPAPARRSRKRSETRSKKEPTAGSMAYRERQKKCSAEWKSAKSAGTVESGMKWPKFFSACNARLKGNSA